MIENNAQVRRSGIAEYWLTRCYSVAQMSGVRRQVDSRKDVVSLWRLLDELARKPTMVTRSWFDEQLHSRPSSARVRVNFVGDQDRLMVRAGQAAPVWL
jgi:hypothetical protein